MCSDPLRSDFKKPMTEKLLLHTIDACTSSTQRDPRLITKRKDTVGVITYLCVACAGMIVCVLTLAGVGP